MSEQEPIKGIQPSSDPQEYVELTRDIVGPSKGVYGLRIKGNALVDVQIIDDDLVTLRRVPPATVEIGDLAHVYIKSMDEYGIMHWTGDTAAYVVQGRVIAVIRHYPTAAAYPQAGGPLQMGDVLPKASTTPAPKVTSTGWQRGSQPAGKQSVLDGHTNATGKAAERVERKTGRSDGARGQE